MKIVRVQDAKGEIFYGSLNGDVINKITGSVYEECTVTDETVAVADVKFLTPCEPTNLYCVGLNYKGHIAELDLPTPEVPANFMKPVSGAVNPGEAIEIPPNATRVDYEGEMALVIKNKIKNVSVEEAKQHIFGIMPLNDVTEREMSYNSTLVTYSKSFDTFSSYGPIIDTEIDPDNATVRTYLNGEKVQEGNSSDLLFDAAYIVSFFSQGRTLYPGDIISTGTPFNVLPMKDGDVVDVEIEGIEMRLSNPVVDPKKA